MCAITGYVGGTFRGVLPRMLDVLRHRGPDDHCVWESYGDVVGLAHARLSILDLTPAGRQPMWDASGRYCIVFNGEIYNYRSFLRELGDAGIRLAGTNDTEVLVNLFALRGDAMLERLNGIFALAIWDSHERVLTLARDGFGVKPLYYAQPGGALAFASELKALVMLPGLDSRLDPGAIAAYLGLGYSPGPATPLAAVRKWPPGKVGRFDHEGRLLGMRTFYSRPIPHGGRVMTKAECERRLLECLDQAVERQLISDAPLGAFLSGGLDSTSIVASIVAHRGRGAVPCYTIRYQGASDSRDNLVEDLPYARRAASHLGVELREVDVDADPLRQMDHAVWQLDEPQGDPAVVNTLLIAKAARADGIKVLLSGTGGDDVFSGYRRHLALQAEALWSWLPTVARAGLRSFTGCLPQDRGMGRRFRKAFAHADSDASVRFAAYYLLMDDPRVRGLFSRDFAAQVSETSNVSLIAAEAALAGSGASPLQRMLYVDQSFFLTDHNLNYTDKMTMAAGVEARVPFLDPDLVEFAAGIPDALKIHRGTAKWIFKESMLGRIPREIAYRPKAGFGAPVRDWIHHRLKDAFEEYVCSDRIRSQGVFRPEAITRALEEDRLGKIDAAYPLLGVLAVDSWIRQFRPTI